MSEDKKNDLESRSSDNDLEMIISIIQLLLVVVLPMIYYPIVYKIIPPMISPYYLVASFVFFLNRKNKILNSFLLTSILPLIYALISFPFGILAVIFHAFPVVIAMFILFERNIDFVSFIIFTVITFFMYLISVFFNLYPVYFSIISIGIIVWIVNCISIIIFIKLVERNES